MRMAAMLRSGGLSRGIADAPNSNVNVIPAMLDCARAYCTLFEIVMYSKRAGGHIANLYL